MPKIEKRHFGPRPAIRGRRRFFDPEKQVEFCQLIDNGATLEEAAEAMDVSIRTVQREMKHDEDFDHEVRLALRSTPDPEKLLKGHARTHWRAAAWLLERTDPDRFARRAPLSATPFQVDHALEMLLNAVLEATPPEFRSEMYRLIEPKREQAFKWVFPNYGPWARRVKTELSKMPILSDERVKAARDPRSRRIIAHKHGSIAVPIESLPPAALTPPKPGPTITSAPAALLAWRSVPNEPEAPARPNESASAPNPTPTRTPTPNRNGSAPCDPPAFGLQPPASPPSDYVAKNNTTRQNSNDN